MDDAAKHLNLGYYLDISIKRRWFVICPFCLAMIMIKPKSMLICLIPKMAKPGDNMKVVFHSIFTLFFIMVNLSLFAVFTMMSLKGLDQTKYFVKQLIQF